MHAHHFPSAPDLSAAHLSAAELPSLALPLLGRAGVDLHGVGPSAVVAA